MGPVFRYILAAKVYRCSPGRVALCTSECVLSRCHFTCTVMLTASSVPARAARPNADCTWHPQGCQKWRSCFPYPPRPPLTPTPAIFTCTLLLHLLISVLVVILLQSMRCYQALQGICSGLTREASALDYPAACGKSRHRASPEPWVATVRTMLVIVIVVATMTITTAAATMMAMMMRRRMHAVTCDGSRIYFWRAMTERVGSLALLSSSQ